MSIEVIAFMIFGAVMGVLLVIGIAIGLANAKAKEDYERLSELILELERKEDLENGDL